MVSGGRSYSLDEAERAKLVQVVTFGGATKIVATGGADVRVELPAGTTAKVRDLTEKGASKPRSSARSRGGGGAVALGGTGAVTAAARRSSRPRPTSARRARAARVKRLAGGKVRLTLKARDASKVAATYVTVARQAHRLPQAARHHGQAAGQAPLRLRGHLGERGGRAKAPGPGR